VGGRGTGWGEKGGGWEKGEEMTQTLYAHMNKRKEKNYMPFCKYHNVPPPSTTIKKEFYAMICIKKAFLV
jgi:hypothetical protein